MESCDVCVAIFSRRVSGRTGRLDHARIKADLLPSFQCEGLFLSSAFKHCFNDKMLAIVAVFASFAVGAALLILKSLFVYFRDEKGLRKFPGLTPLSPFTNLPYMWYAHRGWRYLAVHEAHRKLGPIVRVGPNSVSFNEIAAVKDILGHGSPATKDTFYDLTAGTHRHLADVSSKPDHSRKRRVLAAAFSQAGLEEWEHIVADRARALIDQYDRSCFDPVYVPTPHTDPSLDDPKVVKGFVNHRQWMIVFAEDAIAQIGFSADLKLLEQGHDTVTVTDYHGQEKTFGYRESLWKSQRITTSLVWSSGWYKTLRRLTAWHPYWQHDERYNDMCLDLARRRLRRYQNGEKLQDFFTHLFEDKYGNQNMYPMGELVAEGNILLNAGSDTTGIALTNVIYRILSTPSALAKLREELDAVLQPDEPVAPFDRIKHLPYLRACLDESMRLNPPNTMNTPRMTPPQGMSINGHWIPGHTTVHCPPYNIHRNPQIFPAPEAFNPDRWLGEDGKELQQHFLTFSAGSRGCIGRNITYLEQIIVVASIVYRYDMELLHPDWVLKQTESFTCSPGDMPLKLRRRTVQVKA